MLSVKKTMGKGNSPYGRLGGLSSAEAREKAAEEVRRHPGSPEPRQMLADCLCLEGSFERALKQMQTAASLDASFMPEAFIYRLLIQCETLRAEVFSGHKTPLWHGEPPAWAAHMQEALALTAAWSGALGEAEAATGGSGAETEKSEGAEAAKAADAAREAAFSLVTDTAGQSNFGPFAWISDTDTRLGPVCEMIIQGQYCFVPFSAIASINAEPPRRPRDLIWFPAMVRLRGEDEAPAFIPARYPGSEQAADDMRLARRTEWREQGQTGVFGLGQKMWMTDQGDIPLLDLRECVFAIES